MGFVGRHNYEISTLIYRVFQKDRQLLFRYLDASDADDVEQLHHEERCQQVHERRAGQVAQVGEETETDR